MTYLFPFAEVDKGCRLLLYGAGAVGYEFYQQLYTSGYCKSVKWVDGQYKWYQYINMPVESPDTICPTEVDVVVVAVERKEVYLSIREILKNMGFEGYKIIWKDNFRLDSLELVRYTEERAIEEAKCAVECNPIELLDKNRMDIVVRYIYAKALLNNEGVELARQLYDKMIMTIHQGEEPLSNGANAYFSDYTQKKGVVDFENAFIELLKSMKENGFQKEKFIPLDANGKMINGSHRLAAALALRQNVWVLKYDLYKGNLSFLLFSIEWMKENGFSEEEILLVSKTYDNLVKRKGTL